MSTLQLKSTLLYVDRPDTYTLFDFISYLCEFGFINLFDPRFCVLKTHENALSRIPVEPPDPLCLGISEEEPPKHCEVWPCSPPILCPEVPCCRRFPCRGSVGSRPCSLSLLESNSLRWRYRRDCEQIPPRARFYPCTCRCPAVTGK